MKKTNKFWLILAVCLPGFLQVQAQNAGERGDLGWRTSNDTLFIRAIREPGRMENFPDGTTAPWSVLAAATKSIVIEEGVKNIGNSAFYGFDGLKSVTIPQGVDTIGDAAFMNCHSLPSVTIPESVTGIGKYAFSSCGLLSSVVIPQGADVERIEDYTFYACKHLKSVTIPESVTSIGASAFYNCDSLTSLIIPENVSYIGSQAFSYSGLKSLTNRSEHPQDIADKSVFMGTLNLEVYVPSQSYDEYRYAGGWNECYIKVAVDKVFIERYDDKPLIEPFIVPSSTSTRLKVRIAPDNASAKGVKWHSGNRDYVTVDISGFVFAGDKSGVETYIVVTSDEGNLTDTCWVRIPNSAALLDSLVVDCFSESGDKLSSLKLDTNNLNKVVKNEVSSVVIHTYASPDATVKTIDTLKLSVGVFYPINIGVTAEDKVETNTYSMTLQRDRPRGNCGLIDYGSLTWEFRVDLDSALVISGTGWMQNYGANVPWYAYMPSIKKVVIGDNVESIGANAFALCSRLTSVTIPKSVKHIGNYAFQGCAGLESVISLCDTFSLDNEVFTDSAFMSTLTLYVPDSVISDYRNAPVWKNFGRIWPVVSVHIDKDSIFLAPGKTGQLTATVLPAGNIRSLEWKSSNGAIATVLRDGLSGSASVIALQAGTATITVTVQMDDYPDPLSYSCVVVVNSPTNIPQVGIDKDSISLSPGETEQLTATVLPAGSIRSLEWKSSNGAVATVLNNGLFASVIAHQAGTATITVTVQMDDYPDPLSYSCEVVVSLPTNIPQVGAPSAQVYLSGQILHVDSPVAERVNIYSLTGTLLYRLEKQAGKASFTVNGPKQVLIVRGSSGWAGKIRN